MVKKENYVQGKRGIIDFASHSSKRKREKSEAGLSSLVPAVQLFMNKAA